MTTITTRSGKGSPLTNNEVDANFTNLNDDKVEASGDSMTGNLSFGDNNKAIFGAGSDLQIYHDSSTGNSIIAESGTGSFFIRGANTFLQNAAGTNTYLKGVDGGAVDIRYGGAVKLATTSSGIDITGTVVADGLESSGGLTFTAADGIEISGKESIVMRIDSDDNDAGRVFQVLSGPSASQEILIQASEDAGVSLYYDNAAKIATTSTGINISGTVTADSAVIDNITIDGTEIDSSSSLSLDIAGNLTIDVDGSTVTLADGGVNFGQFYQNAAGQFNINSPTQDKDIVFLGNDGGSSIEAMRIDMSAGGRVGIGTSSPTAAIHATTATAGYTAKFINTNGAFDANGLLIQAGTVGSEYALNVANTAGTTNFMVVKGDGKVGIGTSSPSSKLDVQQATAGNIVSAEFDNTDYTANNRNAIKIRQQVSSSGSYSAYLGSDKNTGNLFLANDSITADHFVINPSGNVGIGTSPDFPLHVSSTGVVLGLNATSGAVSQRFNENGTARFFLSTLNGSNGLAFVNGDGVSERMRIDASGNLLVGKTDTTFNTAGIALRSADVLQVTRSGDTALELNRTSNDGKLAEFYKDGVSVGSIFNSGTTMGVGSLDTGVLLANNIDAILPWNASTNAERGSAIDLGRATTGQFKDLYLSGNAYIGNAVTAGTDGSTSLVLEGVQHIFRKGSAGSYAEYGRFDTSGNLLVGKTSVGLASTGFQALASGNQSAFVSDGDRALILNRQTSDGSVLEFRKDGSTVGSIGSYLGAYTYIGSTGGTATHIGFVNGTVRPATATGATLDATLDLGNSSARWKDLYLSGNVTSSGTFRGGAGSASTPTFLTDGSTGMYRASANDIGFSCGGSEKARIDSSGHFYVGKTNNTLSNDGTVIRASGEILTTNTSDIVVNFNRTGTDGSIVQLYKDGTSVGSISTASGYVSIGTSDTGILFNSGSDSIRPWDTSTNAGRDAAIDLGSSGNRFKNLYLSGRVAAGAGSLGTPTFHCSGDTNTGINLPESDRIQFITGGSERARFDASGNLLVGTTSNITSSGVRAAFVSSGTASDPAIDVAKVDGTTSSSAYFIRFHASSGGTSMGAIAGNGAANVQFVAVSDERLKENIQPLSGSLNKVLALNPVSYDWKANGEHIEAGFVAQEVEQVLPEYVATEEDERQTKALTGGMTAGYIAVLTKAIQEQQEIINDLRARVAQLEGVN